MQPIRILFTEEGVSVSSPGGFVEGIDGRNLVFAEPRGRNPALSEALKRLGFAERIGRGIDLILEGSLLQGRKLPDYSESSSSQVKVFISNAKPDFAFFECLLEGKRRFGGDLPILQTLILHRLWNRGADNVENLSSAFGLAPTRIETSLENLSDLGLVEKFGRNLHGIAEEFSSPKAEFANLEEQIEAILSQKGEISREDLTNLGLSPDSAYRLLRKMVGDGRLESVGKGRGSKYVRKASPNDGKK